MMGSASPLRPNRIVVREDYLTVRLCLSKRLYNLIDDLHYSGRPPADQSLEADHPQGAGSIEVPLPAGRATHVPH